MATFRILVVEDEFVISRTIAAALTECGYEVIGPAKSYDKAIALLQAEPCDLVLLDISLGSDRDGIDLAKIVSEQYELPFIFLTSHTDPATLKRAVETNPSSYLVKPFEEHDIHAAIEVAMANYAKANAPDSSEPVENEDELLMRDCLFIKRDHLFVKVPLADIRYLKSDRMYLDVQTADATHVVRSSFGDMLEKIESNEFFRVHRSYVVNLQHVEAINHSMLIVGGEEIPVGRSYRDQLLSRLKTAT